MGNDHGESGSQSVPSRTTELIEGAFAPPERDGDAAPAARPPRRGAFLVVYHREGVDVAPLAPGSSVVVGREPPEPTDLAIADQCLSRRHARFTLVTAEDVTVEDLGSTNGTRVGGQKIERATVKPGEEVLLGSVAASVHIVTSGDAPSLGLERHDVFRAAVLAEVIRARSFRRKLAVMMVRAARTDEGHLARWAPRVQKILRAVDRVALYSADTLEILLPELDDKEALEVGQAVTQRRAGEPALVCGIACYPGAATSAEELIEVSREAARRATAAQPLRAAASQEQKTLAAKAKEDSLVIESEPMRLVIQTGKRLAMSNLTVLLQGETGTGKEVLTRLIHESGPRRPKPLVCVNCGAIPPTLVESKLFGQVKGAYTGAVDAKGVFEDADGGTLLLDEIGELPPAAQATLLRVLETKRVTRLGSNKEVDIDVRVIAATHRDLSAMCEAGTFRRDLWNRLNQFELSIPPLRERREEIAPLAARFLEQASNAEPREGRRATAIDGDAMDLLVRYSWPGNVRELRNAIERAVVIAEGEAILPRDLPERVRAIDKAKAASCHTGSLKSRMASFEKQTIIEALRESNDNQTAAARLLEVPLRTLQWKIQLYEIRRGRYGSE